MGINDNPNKTFGISDAAAKHLTVKGARMLVDQQANANTVLAQFATDGAGKLATKAGIVAAIGESGLQVVKNPHSIYAGVFQADPSKIPQGETATQAHYFQVGGFGFQGGGALALAKAHPKWTPGHIAFVVEGDLANFAGNETAAAQFYDRWGDEADAIIKAYGGVADPSESDSSSTVAVTYNFTRGTVDNPRENSWDAAQRLAGDVDGWDLFAVASRIYYFSEHRLIRQTPIATIDRADDTVVVSLSGTLDNTGHATEASVTLICGPFDFHAGEVIQIANAGPFSTGPHDGRWIVSETHRSRFEPTTDLTLKLPAPKGIEPPHDTTTGKDAQGKSKAPSEPAFSNPANEQNGQTGSGPAYDARGVTASKVVSDRLTLWLNPNQTRVWVVSWAIPQLTAAKKTGKWTGYISEGWRSLTTEQIYWDRYGHDPGRAAPPGQSNHGFTIYPGGAVDTPDPKGLEAALKSWKGSPPAMIGNGSQLPRDAVHFSVTGR